VTGWGTVRAVVFAYVVVWLVVDASLELAGVPLEIAIAVTDVVVAVYMVAVVVRLVMVDEPLLQALPPAAALVLVIGAIAAFGGDVGVRVESAHLADYYGSVAQVAATLLVALAFTVVRWGAPRTQSLVFISAVLLMAALASALLSLGRGHDSATLFSYSVAGLVLGVLVAGGACALNMSAVRDDDLDRVAPPSASNESLPASPASQTIEGDLRPATIGRGTAWIVLVGAVITGVVVAAGRAISDARRN
jgi:hypothetical protein